MQAQGIPSVFRRINALDRGFALVEQLQGGVRQTEELEGAADSDVQSLCAP